MVRLSGAAGESFFRSGNFPRGLDNAQVFWFASFTHGYGPDDYGAGMSSVAGERDLDCGIWLMPQGGVAQFERCRGDGGSSAVVGTVSSCLYCS